MSKLITFLLLSFISLNAHCWNPFDKSKKTKEGPLTSSEISTLRVDLTRGEGNNLNVKVYNGLQGTVYCDSFNFTENNGNSYPVSNFVSIPSQSIRTFTVKAFNLNNTRSGNLSGCKCEKLNDGQGVCTN